MNKAPGDTIRESIIKFCKLVDVTVCDFCQLAVNSQSRREVECICMEFNWSSNFTLGNMAGTWLGATYMVSKDSGKMLEANWVCLKPQCMLRSREQPNSPISY